MKKRKMPMLQPVAVGPVCTVVSKSGKTEKLKGFKCVVTYDGVVPIGCDNLLRMGLFDGGFGSKCTGLEVKSDHDLHQTTVEYFFRECFLYSDAFARANKFHDAVQDAITMFIPIWQPTILADVKYNAFDEPPYVGGYKVDVVYPSGVYENPLFRQLITSVKKPVRMCLNVTTLEVVYKFKSKNGAQDAYNDAMMFKSSLLWPMMKRAYLLGQMANKNENIK